MRQGLAGETGKAQPRRGRTRPAATGTTGGRLDPLSHGGWSAKRLGAALLLSRASPGEGPCSHGAFPAVKPFPLLLPALDTARPVLPVPHPWPEHPWSRSASPRGGIPMGSPPFLAVPRQPARACAPNPSLPNPELALNEADQWDLSSPSCSCSRCGIAAAKKNTGLLLPTPRGLARRQPPALPLPGCRGWGAAAVRDGERSWFFWCFWGIFWPTKAFEGRNRGAGGVMGVAELAEALAPRGPRHIPVLPRAPAGASTANCRYITRLVSLLLGKGFLGPDSPPGFT